MLCTLEIEGRSVSFDLDDPIDISIPLRFNGPQPAAFGVGMATAEELGDTREDSSVNFERYSLVPHCNGTHTECVGHITHERISVRSCLRDALIHAVLITVDPKTQSESPASAGGQSEEGDRLISRDTLENALIASGGKSFTVSDLSTGLIVRTLPNTDEKLIEDYGESNISPYFTDGAVQLIVELGFQHLLVDMPSIDRLFDGGHLANHRIFWNVEPGSFETSDETRIGSTITEMIYVSDKVGDGEYLLNLQIAPFEADCAPSRPMLFRIK